MVVADYKFNNETNKQKDKLYKFPNELECDIWNIDDIFFKNWKNQYKSWSRQNKINFGIV